MRYLFCFLPLVLSGCLNVPFIPLIDNNKENQSPINTFVSVYDSQVMNNEGSKK